MAQPKAPGGGTRWAPGARVWDSGVRRHASGRGAGARYWGVRERGAPSLPSSLGSPPMGPMDPIAVPISDSVVEREQEFLLQVIEAKTLCSVLQNTAVCHYVLEKKGFT